MDRACKASRRPRVAIITAAVKSYLDDPSYYRPHIKPDEKFHTKTSVHVSKKVSDFFLDEAFTSPIVSRAHFIGTVLGIFLRRYPFKDLVTALHAYADIIGPLLDGRTHGKHSRTKVAKNHQTRGPGLP